MLTHYKEQFFVTCQIEIEAQKNQHCYWTALVYNRQQYFLRFTQRSTAKISKSYVMELIRPCVIYFQWVWHNQNKNKITLYKGREKLLWASHIVSLDLDVCRNSSANLFLSALAILLLLSCLVVTILSVFLLLLFELPTVWYGLLVELLVGHVSST